MEPKIKAIGVMSGTSLDGVDLAACEFWFTNNQWKFRLIKAFTYNYTDKWSNKLKSASILSGLELSKLHIEYGQFIGELVNQFIQETGFVPDLVSSHGHTVFHQPDAGLTLQIGSGAEIAAITRIKTVCDFRTSDVALGGQGAPLVPIGDRLLFGEYNACLNLGGFSNISFEKDQNRVAFDICPVNILLNHLVSEAGLRYDKDGNLGKPGQINFPLLEQLNQLEFYHQLPPKSLGREFLEQKIVSLFYQSGLELNDQLRTAYEHIAVQISQVINQSNFQSVLVTGGGAYNRFLMECLREKSKTRLIDPKKELIDFKEALVFAFLGVLRIREEINCLSSVTGAQSNHCCGTVYL